MTRASLERLRGLLYEVEPHAQTWDAVCDALEQWDAQDAALEVALQYAQPHLAHWPDALRVAPAAWWHRQEAGQREPRLVLARALELSGYRGGPSRAQALASQPGPAYITHLKLANNHLGDAGTLALARSPWLSQLLELDLSVNHLTCSALEALAQSPTLHRLASLDLSYNRVGPMGAQALAQSHSLGRLRSLRLWHNQLGPRGAMLLAESPLLGALEELKLGSNAIGDSGAMALLEAIPKRMTSLRRLDLSGNQIGAETLELFLRHPRLQHLEEMNLAGNAPATIHL